jgi:protein TonB
MRWAFAASIGIHILVALVLVLAGWQRQSALTPPPEPLTEVEVVLSDPARGAVNAGEGEPEPATQAADLPEAPPAPPPAPMADAEEPAETPPAPASLAAPQPPPSPDPAPAASPTPPPPQPEPPSPAPRALAQPPRPPPAPPQATRPAPVRVPLGASEQGRDGGTTDIVAALRTTPPSAESGYLNIPPRYPQEAARRGQQGTVVLSVLVATDGSALSVDIAQSSGHPLLDRAAREAVAKWRFRPGTQGGIAMPTHFPVTLTFRLVERE